MSEGEGNTSAEEGVKNTKVDDVSDSLKTSSSSNPKTISSRLHASIFTARKSISLGMSSTSMDGNHYF